MILELPLFYKITVKAPVFQTCKNAAVVCTDFNPSNGLCVPRQSLLHVSLGASGCAPPVTCSGCAQLAVVLGAWSGLSSTSSVCLAAWLCQNCPFSASSFIIVHHFFVSFIPHCYQDTKECQGRAFSKQYSS